MQTMEQQNDKISFFKGMRDGVPIALGYFAVAFTLGITAGKAGMNALQSSLMSALMLASAGEFAAISMIGSGAGVMEMIVTTVVINMRYLLMSSALSQKVQPNRPFLHRIFMSYAVTDADFWHIHDSSRKAESVLSIRCSQCGRPRLGNRNLSWYGCRNGSSGPGHERYECGHIRHVSCSRDPAGKKEQDHCRSGSYIHVGKLFIPKHSGT